jgi:hypothetical protein
MTSGKQKMILLTSDTYLEGKVEDAKIGFYSIANMKVNIMSKIFFIYRSSKTELLTVLNIRWKNNKPDTKLIIKDTEKITISHNDYTAHSIPINEFLDLGPMNERGMIISKEYIAGKPYYIYSESGYIVVNDVLLLCKIPLSVRHIKYTNRISSTLANLESFIIGKLLI